MPKGVLNARGIYRCERCGKAFDQYIKLCDNCLIALYFIYTVRKDLTLSKIADFYGMCPKGFRRRLSRLRSKEDFPERFLRIGRKCVREGLKVRRIGWERYL